MERKSYLTSQAFKMFLGASILSALSSMLGNIVDGIVVSHLIDYNAMSATSLGKTILQANYTFYQLIGLGASILAAKALGENDKGMVHSLFSLSFAILLAVGLLETLIGIVCPDVVVNAMCKDATLYDYTLEYFRPILIGGPVFLIVSFLGGFVAIDGAPGLVSKSVVVANIANLILDISFIKIFNMGVMGSSVATVIGNIIAIGMISMHFVKGRSQYRLISVRKFSGSVLRLLRDTCNTGFPFFAASICMTVYLYYSQTLIGTHLGYAGLFIFSVMLNIMSIYNMFVTGACTTMQQLAALQLGLNDSYGHRLTVFSAFKFLNITLSVACAFMFIFPEIIARMFDCPDSLLAECCYAVRIYGFAFWIFCVLYLLMVNYKLLLHESIANFISFASSLCVIPVIWYNAIYCKELIWWSNFMAYVFVFACVIIFSLYVSFRRRHDDLVPLFLLPRRSKTPQCDISFDYNAETMHSSFDELSAWLKKQDLAESVIFKVRVIAEELMSNITRHSENKHKNAYVDVRLLITDDAVTLSITDDGTPFNPIENREKGYGLMIANGAANSINYKYQFGQNMTTVVVGR